MSSSEVSRLLLAWKEGDGEAREQLAPLVYDELREVARRYMRSERQITLQPTALVNEAYLRLAAADVPWTERVHFFAVAASIMRRLLLCAEPIVTETAEAPRSAGVAPSRHDG